MMDAKLTLKLNSEIIEKAKQYAASRKQSLSRLVEAYLLSLINKEQQSTANEPEVSPYVKSISSGTKIPKNLDVKEEICKHREEKHL